jgi:transposase
VRLHNQVEALLEDARIKLSTCVTDLLGVSSRRMMEQLAKGETDPAQLAALAEPMLRATPEQLSDALSAAPEMSPLHRQILRLFLDRLELMERQMEVLDRSIAATLQLHQDAVVRLAAVPGLGVDSAQQIIAELGPQAATFRRSAGISKSGGLARVRPFAAT